MFEEIIQELLPYNCSSIFLLEPLGLSRKQLKSLGFLNSYLRDNNREITAERPVFILFKPEDFVKIEDFIKEEYEKNQSLIEDYDYEGGYIVLLYEFPQKWKKDYKLFMYGRYSEFSQQFADIFPKTRKIGTKEVPGFQNMIITRNEEWLKSLNEFLGSCLTLDDEMWQIPNLEKETLNNEKLEKNETPNNVNDRGVA